MENDKWLKGIREPKWGLRVILRRYFYKLMGDESFIRWNYFLVFGRWPNLEHPKRYTEKLQWLKFHDKHDEFTQLVDKFEVKKYVENLIGNEHIIPTLAVYNKFEDIDFDVLPNQFVLKTTHDSGGVVICRDKNKFDIEAAREKLTKSLKNNYFYVGREYPYKGVTPRIIAEKFMVDETGTDLKDYKFFCFDGKCKMLFIASERGSGDVKFDFFDPEFNHIPIKTMHPWSTKEIKKPAEFNQMIEFAETLSKGFRHVR